MKKNLLVLVLLLCMAAAIHMQAQQSAELIGKKLANPVSNMISVPIQNSIDYGIGDYNGSKYLHSSMRLWERINTGGMLTI